MVELLLALKTRLDEVLAGAFSKNDAFGNALKVRWVRQGTGSMLQTVAHSIVPGFTLHGCPAARAIEAPCRFTLPAHHNSSAWV